MPKPFWYTPSRNTKYTRKKSIKGGKNINMDAVYGIAANRKLFSSVANRTLHYQPAAVKKIVKERKNALEKINEEKAEKKVEINEKIARLHGALMNQSNKMSENNIRMHLKRLTTKYQKHTHNATTENKVKRVTLNKVTRYKLSKLNNNSTNASRKATNLLSKKFMNFFRKR